MNLKERIEEICKKLELDAYPHQNYGVIEATTDILKAIRESSLRNMVSYRVEEIELSTGKWKMLVYKDDTKEQCEWVNKQHLDQAISDMKERIG